MQFLDDSLLPENQQPLVIQVAPYGPQFLPSDSDDIPVTMAEQVQKAVDCWNAGATVLHVHVREADGKGSKRLSMFNEMLARLRDAVPGMLLQVGGSISFAPEGEGAAAQVAQRRHAPHAGRAGPEARPGDDRHQHQPDEHLRAAHRRRRGRHHAGRSGAAGGLPRDDDPVGPGLRGRAPEAAAGQRHPAALHARPTSASWRRSSG